MVDKLEIRLSDLSTSLKNIRNVVGKTQKQFIDELREAGLNISYQTYVSYEKQGNVIAPYKVIRLVEVIIKVYGETISSMGFEVNITH